MSDRKKEKTVKPYNEGLVRPPKSASEVERLLPDGTWILDDGVPGLAFSGKVDYLPIAWYPRCYDARSGKRFLTEGCNTERWDDQCPGNIAMKRTADRFRCANGEERPRIKVKK